MTRRCSGSLLQKARWRKLSLLALPAWVGCGHADALRIADTAPGAEPYGVPAPTVVVAAPVTETAREATQEEKEAAVQALKAAVAEAAPAPLPLVTRSKSAPETLHDDEATVRYVGEKACLVQFAGATSLFHAAGLEHLLERPAKAKGKKGRAALPVLRLGDVRIDIVAVGTDGNLDVSRAIVSALHRQYAPTFLVPAGSRAKAQLLRLGIPRANVHEQSPYGESTTGHGHLMAALVPGAEPPAPLPSKKGKRPAAATKRPARAVGYVLSDGHRRVYFAGEGPFGPQFQQVHSHFGAPDLSILNVAASKSTLHLRTTPLTAKEAHAAQEQLNSPVTISLPQAPTFQPPAQDQAAPSTCLITPHGDEVLLVAMGRTGPCEAAPSVKAASDMPTQAAPSAPPAAPNVPPAGPSVSPAAPGGPAPLPSPAPAPAPAPSAPAQPGIGTPGPAPAPQAPPPATR